MQHGVSQHLVWNLQCIYYGQSGKVREQFVDSREFGIRAGVRQGCVLSPRLFCAVLEIALSSWRAKMGTQGLNLHDGMKALLDLRFADDLLVFATSRGDTIWLLEELVTSLAQVGLKLNTSKTKILTTLNPGEFCGQVVVWRLKYWIVSARTNGLDACFKQIWAEIVTLIYSTICKQLHGPSIQIDRYLRTTRFLSKIAWHFFMQWSPQWPASPRATGQSSNKSWPQSMLHTATCSVRWLFRLLVWIGRVHGTKSCMIGTCELQLLWARRVWNHGHKHVWNNTGNLLKSKSKLAGPKAAPLGRKQMEFKNFRSSIMQDEKYKIPLHQHPMFTSSSLHNPIVKAFPDRVFLQCCFPSVGRSPAFPWSSHVPFENPAGPCRAWHAERPGKGSRLKRILASCVQFLFVLALAGQAKHKR